MTLTSFSFLIFVTATLLVYYICPKRFRWIVLLVASFVFYAIVCWKYFPFILFTMLTTFFGALWVEGLQEKRSRLLKENKEIWSAEEKKKRKAETKRDKRLIIALVLVLNFGILFILKGYLSLVIPGFDPISTLTGGKLLLPLGISFYTFQSMGYLVDVYRGKTKAQRNFAKLALFVSFFPQIIQGPIAVYDDLAHQLFEGHDLSYENLKFGFQLILWGLMKKMILADRIVLILNELLADRASYGGLGSLAALLIYALQLYADFSGGIDIARGVAQMLGINMAENFRRPYFSCSLGEYWRRWHITLGAWLKNYLFYPIAMSNAFFKLGKKAKKAFGAHVGKELPGCIATLITFIVIGLWHGANWKYLGFGLWNGGILFASGLLKPVFLKTNEKLHIRTSSFGWKLWQILRTFVLVLVGYAFDIADSLGDSIQMLKEATAGVVRQIADGSAGGAGSAFTKVLEAARLSMADVAVILMGLAVMIAVSVIQEKTGKSMRVWIDEKKHWIEWTLTIAAALAVIFMGMYGPDVRPGDFVYMQF